MEQSFPDEPSTVPFSYLSPCREVPRESFVQYLLIIYEDLISKSQELLKSINDKKPSDLKELPLYTFTLYYQLNPVISQKLFNVLDKDKNHYLSQVEFVEGMAKLLYGSFDEILTLIYAIFDINKDGVLSKRNIQIILSYIPMKSSFNLSWETQETFIRLINKLIDDTFPEISKSEKIDFNYFRSKIIIKGDIIFEFLTYIYSKFSLNLDFINQFHKICNIKYRYNNSMKIKKSFTDMMNYQLTYNKNSFFDNNELKETINRKFCNNSNNTTNIIRGNANSNTNKPKSNKNLTKKGSSLSGEIAYSPKTLSSHNLMGSIESDYKTFEESGFAKIEDITKKFVMKEVYYVLYKKELFIFGSSKKYDLCEYINLSGCFVDRKTKDVLFITQNKVNYYILNVNFFSKPKYCFYFKTKESVMKWEKQINQNLMYRDIKQFYALENVIGEGQFGKVLKCKKIASTPNNSSDDYYAIKKISKKSLDCQYLYKIKLEISYMELINHPNIEGIIEKFEDSESIYIVKPLANGGDLVDYLNAHKDICEKDQSKIIRRIVKGICHLNKFGIVHRDIKFDNILIYEKDNIKSIKITDFGLAITLGDGEFIKDSAGTITYLPPEMLCKEEKGGDYKVDVWSVGVILFFLNAGYFPYDDESENTDVIAKKIVSSGGNLLFPPEHFKNKSMFLVELIENCLEKKVSKRICMDKIEESEWMQRNKN